MLETIAGISSLLPLEKPNKYVNVDQIDGILK